MAARVGPVKEGDLIDKRYLVEREIGKGSFGRVFIGKDQLNNNKQVAIKAAARGAFWFFEEFTQLHLEYMILQQLNGGRLNPYTRSPGGFAKSLYLGVHQEVDQVLVMDLLGPSLGTLFNACERRFSLKTMLIIADQLLYRLQYLHQKGYIHRDLKPENILMGRLGKTQDIVHLIDFGLSMAYWVDRKTRQHIPEGNVKSDSYRVGTMRYMSCRSHGKLQQSRRDDMESMAYVLAYFLRGRLPWQDLNAANKRQLHEKLVEIKMAMTPEQLFHGFPGVFAEFLRCAKELRFEEEPNYKKYHWMFRAVGRKEGIVYWKGGQFDWVLVGPEAEEKEENKDGKLDA